MPSTSGVRIPDQRILDAIYSNEGVIKNAAKALGITARIIYLRMQKDKKFKDAIDDARETKRLRHADEDMILVEKARNSLEALLDKNDVTATIFTLKVKGGFLQVDNSNNQQVITLIDATGKNRPRVLITSKNSTQTLESKE